MTAEAYEGYGRHNCGTCLHFLENAFELKQTRFKNYMLFNVSCSMDLSGKAVEYVIICNIRIKNSILVNEGELPFTENK